MNVQWLAQEFASHLGQAVEMMSGDRPNVDLAGEAAPPKPTSLVWEQTFSIEKGMAWLAGDDSHWVGVGKALLRAAGIEEDDRESAKSTFIEVLNQAFSGLARELSTRLQREVSAKRGAEAARVPEGAAWSRIRLQLGEEVSEFDVAFHPSMLESPVETAAPPAIEAEIAAPRTRSASVENSKTLELLLDVELPVSVSFGRTQLPLRDVIKLTTGAIVELNRSVGEPVEVIVNNCVIARGEVVVVEGNFGVRIQQVVSREDRLRTLY